MPTPEERRRTKKPPNASAASGGSGITRERRWVSVISMRLAPRAEIYGRSRARMTGVGNGHGSMRRPIIRPPSLGDDRLPFWGNDRLH